MNFGFVRMSAIGAYGRYSTIDDWESGKDFYSMDFERYFSIRDIGTLKRNGILEIDFFRIGYSRPVFTVKL